MLQIGITSADVGLPDSVTDSEKLGLAEKALELLREMPAVAFDFRTDLPPEPISFIKVDVTAVSADLEIREIRLEADKGHRKRPEGRSQPTNWGVSTTWGESPVRFKSAGSTPEGDTMIRTSFKDTAIVFTI
jgi:hypothetical protein